MPARSRRPRARRRRTGHRRWPRTCTSNAAASSSDRSAMAARAASRAAYGASGVAAGARGWGLLCSSDQLATTSSATASASRRARPFGAASVSATVRSSDLPVVGSMTSSAASTPRQVGCHFRHGAVGRGVDQRGAQLDRGDPLRLTRQRRVAPDDVDRYARPLEAGRTLSARRVHPRREREHRSQPACRQSSPPNLDTAFARRPFG